MGSFDIGPRPRRKKPRPAEKQTQPTTPEPTGANAPESSVSSQSVATNIVKKSVDSEALEKKRNKRRWKNAFFINIFTKEWWKGLKNNHPRQFLGLSIAFVLLVVIGYGSYVAAMWHNEPYQYGFRFRMGEVHEEVVEEEEEPFEAQSLVPRFIDGVIVSQGEENQPIVAIMIENLYVVRPQSGLQAASVVYETLAEGGITRFMAMYPGGGGDAEEIRPVRSARPYYLEWAGEVDAAYAHAGGSPNALRALSGFDYRDLNGLGLAAPYFWRGAGGSPHNFYTSSEKMELAVRDNGWEEPRIDYRKWKFDDDPSDEADREIRKISEPPEPLPTKEESDKMFIGFSGIYSSSFEYDPDSNSWLRWNGGTPHIDKNTGEQIKSKNVVIQRVPSVGQEAEKGRLIMNVTGEGQAWVCKNGNCTEGRWKKEARERRTLWYEKNEDGSTNTEEELHLTRGNTWVVVVPEPFGIDVKGYTE